MPACIHLCHNISNAVSIRWSSSLVFVQVLTELETRGINLVRESQEILLIVREK